MGTKKRVKVGARLPVTLALLLLAGVASAAHSETEGSVPTDRSGAQTSTFTLHVPADAEVWFNGVKTRQTGRERVFQSPLLNPGRAYSYTVRVRWADGDWMVERSRSLSFEPGDHLTLALGRPGRQVIRSNYLNPASAAAEQPSYSLRPASPVSYPVYPYSPLYNFVAPSRNVAPMSEQDPYKEGLPPGSNTSLPSFQPGYG